MCIRDSDITDPSERGVAFLPSLSHAFLTASLSLAFLPTSRSLALPTLALSLPCLRLSRSRALRPSLSRAPPLRFPPASRRPPLVAEGEESLLASMFVDEAERPSLSRHAAEPSSRAASGLRLLQVRARPPAPSRPQRTPNRSQHSHATRARDTRTRHPYATPVRNT
eukprot:7378458-Prymnesium_polylepis.1